MFVPKSDNSYKVYEQKNAIYKDITIGNYFISKEKFNELKSFEVFPNDIIVSCAGTIGESYILPQKIPKGIINQALMKITLYVKEMQCFYQYYFDMILKSKTNEDGKGSAMKNIPPFDILKKYLFPLPPLAEQERIVAKIEELFAQIDRIEEEKQSLLKLIDRTKEKVLDLAMKGKLVEQDPNDEPASVLLEKIFEEKKKLAKEGKIKLSKDELLPPKISDDNDYYEKLGYNTEIYWIKCKLGDVLFYEQPTHYIVANTNYNDRYKTPVLTAGKTFILGYTNEEFGVFNDVPCIIFDDFTTESKYIDFPFKVKSSAMKILKANSNVCLKYIYFFMKQIKINIDTHKRYWISDYSNREIILPSPKYQYKAVKLIENTISYLDKLKAELY